jgi:eukaryotic translation initiation factor 2C
MQRGGRGRGGQERGRGVRGSSPGGDRGRWTSRGGFVPGGGRGRGGIFAEGQPAVIDSRLANSAEDRLILSFKDLSLRQDAMPPRPDYGTKGRYFSLHSTPMVF